MYMMYCLIMKENSVYIQDLDKHFESFHDLCNAYSENYS
jgi:hypothetical protein